MIIFKNPKFHKLINEIIAECHDDQEGLWSIIAALKHSGIVTQPNQMHDAVLMIIHTLLNDKDIVAMNYSGNKYHIWNLTAEDAVSRINQEWLMLGREPGIGDIVWFTSKARAQQLRHL